MFAPAGTPLAIRTQIGREVARILELPDVKGKLHDMAYNIDTSTPQELDAILREQIKAFSEIAKRLGLVES